MSYVAVGATYSCSQQPQFAFHVTVTSYEGSSPTEDSLAACSDKLDNDDNGDVDCDDYNCIHGVPGACP